MSSPPAKVGRKPRKSSVSSLSMSNIKEESESKRKTRSCSYDLRENPKTIIDLYSKKTAQKSRRQSQVFKGTEPEPVYADESRRSEEGSDSKSESEQKAEEEEEEEREISASDQSIPIPPSPSAIEDDDKSIDDQPSELEPPSTSTASALSSLCPTEQEKDEGSPSVLSELHKRLIEERFRWYAYLHELGMFYDFWILSTCLQCKRMFSCPRDASRCLRYHDLCRCWKCNRTFEWSPKALAKHYQSFHNFTPYQISTKCPYCWTMCSVGLEFRRHIEEVHFHLPHFLRSIPEDDFPRNHETFKKHPKLLGPAGLAIKFGGVYRRIFTQPLPQNRIFAAPGRTFATHGLHKMFISKADKALIERFVNCFAERHGLEGVNFRPKDPPELSIHQDLEQETMRIVCSSSSDGEAPMTADNSTQTPKGNSNNEQAYETAESNAPTREATAEEYRELLSIPPEVPSSSSSSSGLYSEGIPGANNMQLVPISDKNYCDYPYNPPNTPEGSFNPLTSILNEIPCYSSNQLVRIPIPIFTPLFTMDQVLDMTSNYNVNAAGAIIPSENVVEMPAPVANSSTANMDAIENDGEASSSHNQPPLTLENDQGEDVQIVFENTRRFSVIQYLPPNKPSCSSSSSSSDSNNTGETQDNSKERQGESSLSPGISSAQVDETRNNPSTFSSVHFIQQVGEMLHEFSSDDIKTELGEAGES